MKTATINEYGGPEVLKIEEVEMPVPKEGQLLVKVHAVPINFGDIMGRNFRNVSSKQFNMPFIFWLLSKIAFGLRKPRFKVLGNSFSGEVTAVGTKVSKFKVGEQVYGYTGASFGCYSEYITISENGIVDLKPENISHEEAATIPYGALTALNLLRGLEVRPGDKVLIIGASGSIGSAALQLLKNINEADITAVCGSNSFEYVKELGADNLIDYKKTPLDKHIQLSQNYSLIIDVLGRSTFTQCKNLLSDNGTYLRVSFKSRELLQMLWSKVVGGKRVICKLSGEKPADLKEISSLIKENKIKAIIDQTFLLSDVTEAHQYYESGERKGSVVIKM